MNTSKKQINFNLNDFLPFIDGLDIAINFSLVIFLSSFLLESLDTRIAVVILCFVTSLSFISRIKASVLELQTGHLQACCGVNFF